MKIRSAVFAGLAALVTLFVVGTLFSSNDFANENTIRVAYFPNIGHAVPIIGIENEIFSDGLGNQTKIETKLFDSGPQVIESLFANSIDIAYVGPGPAINGFLKSENQNIRILAGSASGGASFITHPDSEIKSANDFISKRIATPQIGNTQDVSLRNYLHEHNLSPAEKGGSVFVLNIPNPDIYTLFAKGDIDAAWVPEPWATILVQELGGERLFFEEELWPENQFASVLLIANINYVENNPEIIQKWLVSHSKTVSWINSNPKQTQGIFNQFMKKTMGQSLSDKVIEESLSNLEITDDPITESIYTIAQRADSLGYLGRNGYNLDGIFYEIDSNSNTQEAIILHVKT